MSKLDLSSSLFTDLSLDNNLLFEQYKLYVEMMDKVSERRHQTNSFFLTVNTVVISALASISGLTIKWVIIPSIAGIVFSISWFYLIESYKQLNAGKFEVIHLLETRMPARLYFAEWEFLQHGDGKKYRPFTNIERYVPWTFALLYLGMILLAA